MASARTMALAYRIWAYASPREWDVTIPEVADEMKESVATIRSIMYHKGWLPRVRRVSGPVGTIVNRRGLMLDVKLHDEREWV